MDGRCRESERDGEVGRGRGIGKGREGVPRHPAWGNLQPHATLEPSISPEIYEFLVQRLLVATTRYTISVWRGVGAAPCRETMRVVAPRGFRAIHARERRRPDKKLTIRSQSVPLPQPPTAPSVTASTMRTARICL